MTKTNKINTTINTTSNVVTVTDRNLIESALMGLAGWEDKTVQVHVIDQTGHSEFSLKLAEALQQALDAYFKDSRFPYVNNKPIAFPKVTEKNSPQTKAALQQTAQMIININNPVIMITGDLVGGC